MRRISIGPSGASVQRLCAGVVAAAQEWVRQAPARRVGEAGDIARVIALLCSPDARWITGQAIVVYGRLTLR